MSDIAISVENLSKRYRIGLKKEMHSTMGGAVAALATTPIRNFKRLTRLSRFGKNGRDADDIIWALKDVSFEVKKGEVIGIIGRNGAGKSTLLKILCRITEPTEGRATLNGRVGALLEVGTGFHPELTGRENVYLNGAILGMTRGEIKRKFDEIVDFSGVEKFIDTPVKRYSSGMKVRLAFAVAAHLEPEILIVDEVLAVGDAEFQKKCLDKMQDVTKEGRTVLFVSHNMGAITRLCPRAVLLVGGELGEDGETSVVTGKYLSALLSQTCTDLSQVDRRGGNGQVRITGVHFEDGQGREVQNVVSGTDLRIRLIYETKNNVHDLTFAIGFYNNLGIPIFHCNSGFLGFHLQQGRGQGSVSCVIPRIPLPASEYRLNVAAMEGGSLADHLEAVVALQVLEGDYFGFGKVPPVQSGVTLVDHAWS